MIEEILDELAGSKYFTKLDMESGYDQVRMLVEDEYKTAFKNQDTSRTLSVQSDTIWSNKCTSTFQCIMNEILKPFRRKFVLDSVWMSILEGMELNWVQYQINHGIEMRYNSNSIVWMSLYWSTSMENNSIHFYVWMYKHGIGICSLLPPGRRSLLWQQSPLS